MSKTTNRGPASGSVAAFLRFPIEIDRDDVELMERLKGPSGMKGPEGPRGPQGTVGVSDVPGPQGIQGMPGPRGEIGPQGDKGPQGIQGEQGVVPDGSVIFWRTEAQVPSGWSYVQDGVQFPGWLMIVKG